MRKPIIGKEDLVTWCKQNNKEYLLDEWDYEKNDLKPEEFFPKSEKIVMWKCKKEYHSYPAPIYFRTTQNTNCCYCTGKRVLVGFNDFRTWCEKNDRIDMLKEWSMEGNLERPEDCTKTAHKKIIWKCSKCGNNYPASIADRTTKSSGCPYCSGRLPILGKTDLLTWCQNNDREDLINDWNSELNDGKSMQEYTYASDKKVIWKCHICSFEWKTEINARTVGNGGCSKCSVSGTSFPEQFIYLVLKSLYRNTINRDKTHGVELDIFIPEYSIAIEYNGTYYHESQQKNDEKKRELCKQRGINLLQIYEKVKDRDFSGDNIICWQYSRRKDKMIFLAKDIIRWISIKTGCLIQEM